MHSNNSNRSRAASARGFMALFAIALAMGLALADCPAEAAPLLYVANFDDNTVSVIDTATNRVVGSPIPVGSGPQSLAVTPDGTKVYVANMDSNNVSVIHRPGNGSLCHFFEAFGDELIDAFSRLRGLFGDAAMKLRGNAQ
jgi:YVTN family beta-propeller protein